MAKPGPKTLFKDYMIQESYKLGALGLTMEEIADFWNISRRTLTKWANKHPEFSYNLNKGRSEADLTVIQALLEQCKGGNVIATIFWLKNRQPEKWKDVQHVKGEGFETKQIFNIINNFKEGELIDYLRAGRNNQTSHP